MWEQYRKTLIPTQAVIITICIAMYFIFHARWQEMVMIFLTMQFCAVIGARWAVRLKRKVTNSNDRLPLTPKA